jgi:hypothetical protein
MLQIGWFRCSSYCRFIQDQQKQNFVLFDRIKSHHPGHRGLLGICFFVKGRGIFILSKNSVPLVEKLLICAIALPGMRWASPIRADYEGFTVLPG